MNRSFTSSRKRSRRVVVTGMGLVSPLGSDLRTFWNGLCHKQSGVRPIVSFDTAPFRSSLGGQVTGFDVTDFIRCDDARQMSKASHFAVAAALMAVGDADLIIDDRNADRIVVSIGTALGGLTDTLEAQAVARSSHGYFSLPDFADDMSVHIARALKLQGSCEIYSNGCASTANAIGRAYDSIQRGDTDVAIAGGTEAPFHPYVFSRIESDGLLAPDFHGAVIDLPRPFDDRGCGMVLGEGAGCLVLESYERAIGRHACIYGEVAGWGMTFNGEADEAQTSRLCGRTRAIKKALRSAHWFPEEIDYINASGLGIQALDIEETQAIKDALGPRAYQIPISTLKPSVGHAFGASGAFQIISTLLSMQHQYVPATLNLQGANPQCDLDYVSTVGRPWLIRKSLINSFGIVGSHIVLAVRHSDNSLSTL